jgi:hypothetical protein
MTGTPFKPGALLEGYTEDETFKAVEAVSNLLDDIYGNDKEAKIVTLSFLLGRHLVGAKVTEGMSHSMIRSAHNIAVALGAKD